MTKSERGAIPGACFAQRVAGKLCIETTLGGGSMSEHAASVLDSLKAIGVKTVEPEAEKTDEIYGTVRRLFRVYDPEGNVPALVHFRREGEAWIVTAITVSGPRLFG
jgi:hypothetical protein